MAGPGGPQTLLADKGYRSAEFEKPASPTAASTWSARPLTATTSAEEPVS